MSTKFWSHGVEFSNWSFGWGHFEGLLEEDNGWRGTEEAVVRESPAERHLELTASGPLWSQTTQQPHSRQAPYPSRPDSIRGFPEKSGRTHCLLADGKPPAASLACAEISWETLQPRACIVHTSSLGLVSHREGESQGSHGLELELGGKAGAGSTIASQRIGNVQQICWAWAANETRWDKGSPTSHWPQATQTVLTSVSHTIPWTEPLFSTSPKSQWE